jgi:hypothetical protein
LVLSKGHGQKKKEKELLEGRKGGGIRRTKE